MARITVAEARTRLDAENARLAAALKRYVQETGVDLKTQVEKTAFTLEARIKARTPVDTGRARASWHTVIFGRPASYTYTAKALGRSARTRVGQQARAAGVRAPRNPGGTVTYDGTLSAYPPNPQTAIVGSNVEYMPALEAGSSKKAPAGMVRISLAEMREEFRAEIKAVLARRRRLGE